MTHPVMRISTPVRRTRLALLALALLATGANAAHAASDLVDVRELPRLDGAVNDAARTEADRLVYTVPGRVPETSKATRNLLSANGWIPYVAPLEETASSLLFKKGKLGLSVSFTQALGRPDQSAVYYNANRIYADVPFPQGATDIVFDERRPYLRCTAPGTVETNLAFFNSELAAAGWMPLAADDAATRWPNAKLDSTLDNGARAYFRRDDRDRQAPIVLALQTRADGRTAVEVKVAPFALPPLESGSDISGFPKPVRIKTASSTGSSDAPRREFKAAVIAELEPTLAFYRRELAARGWKEEANGASVTGDAVALNFTSPDTNGAFKLSRAYDLTLVSFVTQITPAALAARAKAKQDADDKFMADAAALATQMIAADNARRATQAAGLSDAPLRAQADTSKPVPLPEGAETIDFDGDDGKLDFAASASVKAIAAFYRNALKPLGWKERPSVINNPNMAVLEFAKGSKRLSFTVMQMGPKANVSATGSGLVMANAAAASKPGAANEATATDTAVQTLEAEADSELPVPKQHSLRSLGTGKLPGSDAPFRRELTASIPANLASVLAFYRGELSKRGWKELPDGAISQPDRVRLAFASPDGPALLKLGRQKGETTVLLAQKIPAAAAKGEVLPKPGQSRLMLGNIGPAEASITINKRTIKLVAGAGGPQSPQHPALDLPPGKYKYSTKVAGRPGKSGQIELGADDAWGLMLGPDGDVLALQAY